MDLKALLLFSLVICVAAKEGRSRKKDDVHKKLHKFRGETLEQLFTVYDTSFLAVVWPKITNGVHVSLGHFCWEDLSVFFKDLTDGKAWAYSAADASGRYQGGVFGGGRVWLGSKQRCNYLDNDFLSRDNSSRDGYDTEYLSALLQRETVYGTGEDWRQLAQRDSLVQQVVVAEQRPPHRLAYSVARLVLNLTRVTMAKSYDITLGLCLPRSCNQKDVESLISFSIVINDNLRSNRTVPRVARLTGLRRVDGYRLERDPGGIILIVITSFLLILSLAATAVELNVIRCRIRPRLSRSVSFDLQKYNTNTQKRYYDEVKKTNDMLFKEANPDLGRLNKIVDVNDGVCKSKPGAALPTVTLDVTERGIGSCNRCGKYKKQCDSVPVPDKLGTCPRVRYSSVASLSSQEKRSNLMRRLLLCCSLRYSMRRLCNTNLANKDLAATHLLRVVATLWVMYVHVALIVFYVAGDGGVDIDDRNAMYYILTTGTLAFDTLFFVSGLFSSHHFFYLKSHYTVEELVSFGGPCGQILQFVCFVTNRIIRLLPSYAYVILLTGVVARVSRDTAALALPDGDHDNCDLYWWRNMLYITNVYPHEERCMQVSWYLSAESQLHVAGALACAARGGARGRGVLALGAAALLAATAADVSAAYLNINQYLPGVYEAYILIIERPWARVVPYFIGIFTGWMVHKANGRFSVSKVTACCLWSASASTLLTSSLIPWLALDWLTAWVHLTWPLALLWPTLVFATNYAPLTRRMLDSGSVAALSRLCYSMLLLHGCVARVLLLAADTALCSHAACVWSYFAGTTTLTILGGLLLSLLVEMPCCSLLRRISDCATV